MHDYFSVVFNLHAFIHALSFITYSMSLFVDYGVF